MCYDINKAGCIHQFRQKNAVNIRMYKERKFMPFLLIMSNATGYDAARNHAVHQSQVLHSVA